MSRFDFFVRRTWSEKGTTKRNYIFNQLALFYLILNWQQGKDLKSKLKGGENPTWEMENIV